MKIVVEANVLVALAVPTDYSTSALEKFAAWLAQEISLFAPALWSYEAVQPSGSSLRPASSVRQKRLLQ